MIQWQNRLNNLMSAAAYESDAAIFEQNKRAQMPEVGTNVSDDPLRYTIPADEVMLDESGHDVLGN